MQREDFIQYRKEHYVAKATTIVVAGDIAPQKVFASVEKSFEKTPVGKKSSKKKTLEKQKGAQVAVQYKKTDQTHLILGLRTFPRKHKDSPVLELLAGILGQGMSSRLFDRLREQMGVGYYVRSYHEDFTDHGFLEIMTGVTNTRVEEVVAAIVDECQQLAHELVSERELQKTKEYVIGALQMELEASDDIAQFFGFQEVLDKEMKTPQQIIKELKGVTPKDIQRVAKKVIKNDRLNLALIGPFKDAKKFKKLLRMK
jgi:predicted Zn-dependent peptidase